MAVLNFRQFLKLALAVAPVILCPAGQAASWKIEQNSEAAGDYSVRVKKDSFILEVKKLNLAIFDGSSGEVIVLDRNTKSYTSTPASKFCGLDQGRIMESALRELRDGKQLSQKPSQYRKWKATTFLNFAPAGHDDVPCNFKTICLDDNEISPTCCKIVCQLNLIPIFDRLPLDCRRMDGFPCPRLITTFIIDNDQKPLQKPNLALCKKVKTLPSYSVTTDPETVKNIFGF